MKQADIDVEFPTSADIARALCAAARRGGEDPIAILQGRPGSRARLCALVALGWRFPTANRTHLGARLGEPGVANRARNGISRQRVQWLRLDDVNQVCAACGWPAMTREQVLVAPLLFCGRPWRDFVIGGDAESRAAPVKVATAKANIGSAPSPPGGAGNGLRVGVAEGAQPPRDAAAALGPRRVDQIANAERASCPSTPDALPCAPPFASPAAARPGTAWTTRRLGPLARVIDRRPVGGDVTAAICGDPPPGRSALAQRQAR